MTRIVFRVDGGPAIGTGHLVRCATLGTALAARGGEVHFICQEPAAVRARLVDVPAVVHEIAAVDGADDARRSAAIVRTLGTVDWLVVDHYQLDRAWERTLRSHVDRLMVIDDRADRQHDCDLLLDQNLVADQDTRYAGLIPAACRRLLGPHYALLHPEFANARATLAPREGQLRRVLVCFGGSDPHNHTAAALRALAPLADRLPGGIDVVVGPANHRGAEIAAACSALPGARLHAPALAMAELLARADLAIGAGGTMNWERACLGVPSLVFAVADNQRPGLEALITAGAVVGNASLAVPDATPIGHWLAVLAANAPLLRGLASRSAALVDGLGTRRVAAQLLPATLHFRPATREDSANLLSWRNAPAVRSASLDARPIAATTHSIWLERTLADRTRRLLIAECGPVTVGVVRFDLAPPRAYISVYRTTAGPPGLGLIRQAMAWLSRHHPEIRTTVAEVLPGNSASLAAFQGAGFRPCKNTLIREMEMP